jgi:hypothetical protein
MEKIEGGRLVVEASRKGTPTVARSAMDIAFFKTQRATV